MKKVDSKGGKGNKRVKFNTKLFEPDAGPAKKKARLETEERVLMFRSGEYLALRDENGEQSHSLCESHKAIFYRRSFVANRMLSGH